MNRIWKTLLVSLLASLLIHFLLLGFFPKITRPDFGKKPVVLETRIVSPKKPIRFKPLAPPRPKTAKPKASETGAPPSIARTESASPPQLTSAPTPASMPMPASTPQAASAPLPEQEKEVGVPSHAVLTFNVFRGNVNVGIAVHTWDITDDGRYAITNRVSATGIFALFVKGAMTQTSEGRVTEKGLQPELYTITRGGEQNRQEAHFDWKTMKLELVSNGVSQEVELEPMTQDQLSFLYQFAYTPPKEGIFSFHSTDGRKIDIYDYQILGEETVLSGAKKIRTLHLKKLHDAGVEGTEIWLDEDHYYWPVAVLMTDKNGDTMRQLISQIEEKR